MATSGVFSNSIEPREKNKHLNSKHKSTCNKIGDLKSINYKQCSGLSSQPGEDVSESRFKEDMLQVLQKCKIKNNKVGNLNEYKERNRQIFLINYSIKVKRDEIDRLRKEIDREQAGLQHEVERLNKLADQFDRDLKESDSKAVEAIKAAESETKLRLKKERNLKKLKSAIYNSVSELNSLNEGLQRLEKYSKFVNEKIAPKFEAKLENKETSSDRIDTGDNNVELLLSSHDFIENLIREFEETNYNLITKNRDIGDSLEELKISHSLERFKLEQETELVRENETFLRDLIKKAQAKAREYETTVRLYSFGDYDRDDQDRLLDELEKQIGLVYGRHVEGRRSTTTAAAAAVSGASDSRNQSASAASEAAASRLHSKTYETHLLGIEKRLDSLLARRESIVPLERYENARRFKEHEWQVRAREEEELRLRKGKEAKANENNLRNKENTRDEKKNQKLLNAKINAKNRTKSNEKRKTDMNEDDSNLSKNIQRSKTLNTIKSQKNANSYRKQGIDDDLFFFKF